MAALAVSMVNGLPTTVGPTTNPNAAPVYVATEAMAVAVVLS